MALVSADAEVQQMKNAIVLYLNGQADNRTTRSQLQLHLDLDRLGQAHYAAAEQSLLDDGVIDIRRGREGGIFLSNGVSPTLSDKQVAETVADERQRERDHYEKALKVLRTDWALDERFLQVFGCVTAGQGRRRTGGRWTRPDLTTLCISKRIFDAGKQADVRTFEVKLFEALDVAAVFEALSHRARAHYSYLLIVDAPRRSEEADEARLEAVVAEAARHGVGVFTASATCDYKRWERLLDARLSDADPTAIEDFVTNQVPEAVKNAFVDSLHG